MPILTQNIAGEIEPALIIGFASVSETTTVVHQVIGRAEPDITVGSAQLQSGTLELLFMDESSTLDAVEKLKIPGVWSVLNHEIESQNIRFVVLGQIQKELTEGRKRWLVRFEFQEVA